MKPFQCLKWPLIKNKFLNTAVVKQNPSWVSPVRSSPPHVLQSTEEAGGEAVGIPATHPRDLLQHRPLQGCGWATRM